MRTSMTPDHFRKVGLGVTPSPSPFPTPRPERRRPESRGSEWNCNRQDSDKEVNVQVLLRCRPLSDEEQRGNVPRVISCNESRKEVTVTSKQADRVFTFDKVFGPKSQQRSIYDQAIVPIVNEVLEGFNCTVFAYGQTGTGKTYTMEGGMRNKVMNSDFNHPLFVCDFCLLIFSACQLWGGDLPAEAGVIPRAVRQIFDTLEAQNADYSMKVTFLELYNEEITDLLAPEDSSKSAEDRQKKPVSLMEDGKGCVILRGLEEEAVYSANEIYSLLDRGAAKRRTADTLLNKRSSRSHSVFSITVHVKEAVVGDEELIKCGKLNLVDLAGSENISRSGAREGRAREAGEINKSLLTLGRVINALVEHSAHIPYRDSKLTRLLRDSLGGKTKTCIIATISPAAHSLEETLSTLDYAYRAKSIKNKPEANQKMSKAVLLKDLYLEIERMKEDVRAARERNGVYVPYERFAQDEAEKKLRIEKIEQLENDLNLSEKQVDKFRELYLTEQEQKLDVESELKDYKMNLEKTNKELLDVQENCRVAISTLAKKEFVISKLLNSESSLIERAKELRSDLQIASEDITLLFSKLDQKNEMEAENHSMVLTFGSHLDQSLKDLHKIILKSVSQQQQQVRCMEEHAHSFFATKSDATKLLESKIKKMTETYTSGAAALKELASSMQAKNSSNLDEINSKVSSQIMVIENFLAAAVLEANKVTEEFHNSLNEQKQLLTLSSQQQHEGLNRSLISAQALSKATENFLNDLHHQAAKVMTFLDESQIQKSYQLADFEKKFKKEAAREEKEALENIALILATLTSKKTAMVAEASRHIQDSSIQDSKTLQQVMSNMQNVSSNAREKLCKYAEKAERTFMENTFSVAESTAVMQTFLQECAMRVDNSKLQWENVQSDLNDINKTSYLELESTVKEKIIASHVAHEELLSSSSEMDADFGAQASDMMDAVDDMAMQDQESKKHADSMVSLFLDQLKSTQENHGESVLNIRSKAEKCLTQDYMVDSQTGTMPNRHVMEVPSLASLEAMRMPAEDVKEERNIENLSKRDQSDSKIRRLLWHRESPIRAPFADVNN